MKKEPEQFFQEFKRDITTFAELKVELLKLEAYERTGKIISVLSFGLILTIIVLFLLLFLFLALGFFLSEWLGSMGLGFSIVAAFYLLLMGITYLLRNKIQMHILNLTIAAFMQSNKKENNDDNPTENNTDAISKASA